MNNTPTPRTDKASDWHSSNFNYAEWVSAHFARTLERETIRQRAEIAELVAALSELKDAFWMDSEMPSQEFYDLPCVRKQQQLQAKHLTPPAQPLP